MQPEIFQNLFFARAMNQSFNAEASIFVSDEYEPALRKWMRAHGKL